MSRIAVAVLGLALAVAAQAPATAATVARILESIGRTIAYAQDIAQVALDRSLGLAGTRPAPRRAAPAPAV